MRRPFPSYPPCPVCGDPAVNAGTLAVRWWWEEECHQVVGSFTPRETHAGYGDCLHGGVLLSLFDEALAWASAAATGSFCYTGELATRFRRPIPLGAPIEITAWVVTARGPYVRAAGQARDGRGNVLATSSGTYAAMETAVARRLQSALRLGPGDVDVLAGPLHRS